MQNDLWYSMFSFTPRMDKDKYHTNCKVVLLFWPSMYKFQTADQQCSHFSQIHLSLFPENRVGTSYELCCQILSANLFQRCWHLWGGGDVMKTLILTFCEPNKGGNGFSLSESGSGVGDVYSSTMWVYSCTFISCRGCCQYIMRHTVCLMYTNRFPVTLFTAYPGPRVWFLLFTVVLLRPKCQRISPFIIIEKSWQQ